MLIYIVIGGIFVEEITNRVILLRKTLKLSQKSLGDAIGLSNSGISNIENGIRNVTDQHIKLLVSTFNVNEQWLRTGEGEMFIQLSADQELDKLIGEMYANDNEFTKNFVRSFLKLSEDEQSVIKKFVKSIQD